MVYNISNKIRYIWLNVTQLSQKRKFVCMVLGPAWNKNRISIAHCNESYERIVNRPKDQFKG